MALLEARNLTRRFGGIVAVDDVTFDVPQGEIVGLIGPNGAGKTTVFNLVTRLYSPDGGDISSRARASCGFRRTRSSAGASRVPSRTSRSSPR